MSYDYKKSVQAAVEKFNEKNDPNYSKPTRKNQKPEEEFIHNELVPFLKCANGVDQLFGPNNWKEHEAKIFFDTLKRIA